MEAVGAAAEDTLLGGGWSAGSWREAGAVSGTGGWDSAAKDWVAALGTGNERDPVAGGLYSLVFGVLGESIRGGGWAWIGEKSEGIGALSSGLAASVL